MTDVQATTAAVQPGPGAVHFILQGKGGVGKSLVAALLAQYFQATAGGVQCIDTDPVNQTLMSYQALGARHLELMQGSRIDERRFDALMERLLTEPGLFVVDNGAASFVPMSNYLIENHAIDMLHEAGRAVFVHCVVTGGQALFDTLAGFKALADQTPSNNLVVWLNEYFGLIEHDGKVFTEMRVYIEHARKVRGLVRIAQRNQDTFGKDIEEMASRKLTFDEVLLGSAFSLMAKQRLKTVQKDLFQQLRALAL